MAARRQSRNGQKTRASHIIEWVVAALGVLTLCGSVAFLIYTALTEEDAPPSIGFHTVAVHSVSGGYLVEVALRNSGSQTAAKLKVAGLLSRDGQVVETSEASFDYVPSRSERRGGLFSTNDPRKFQLRFQAQGYEKP